MDATKTVTAIFTLKPILTVLKDGTGGGTVTSTTPAGDINCGTDCTQTYNDFITQVTLTANGDANSLFTGWSGACTAATGPCVVTMDAAKTVTAKFTLRPVLTVTKTGTGAGTVTSSPAGINCGSDCTQSYTNFTTQVTLTAAPSSDSDFAGWGGACSGTGSCVVTMDAAKSVTATFVLKSFSLDIKKAGTGTGTVTSSPAGINCGTDCSQDYTIHTDVTLTAMPDADAVFAGWSGACTNTSGDCVVTMDRVRSVEAKFTKTFTLTVSLDPAGNGSGRVTGPGINCGAGSTDCSEVYTIGTTIELAAEPEPPSQFSGWSGDCTGTTSPCTLFIDSNKSVQARFDLVVLPAP